MTSQDRWRRWLVPMGIVVLFFVLSLVYFAPAVGGDLDIYQPDVAGASGTAQDVRDYYDQTGEVSYWTNSLFGGMPMYQISPSYPSLSPLKAIQDLLTLQIPLRLLPSYSWLLFVMMLGFYLFMRSLEVRRLGAVLGAVMWTFSSYFLILIVAGHIWKLTVLAFIPPTIAGIIYIFRGRYWLGGAMTTFFAALQLMSNHVQMSYYFAFVIASLVLAYVIDAVKARAYTHLAKALSVTALSAVLSIGMNISNIYHTYEYTQQTMRGGASLATDDASGGGLDKAYITAWSYGIGETYTLLVPNLYGGATGYLADDRDAMAGVAPQLREMVGQMNHYWGDQPFTAGPVYVGAFVLFLGVLGFFVVRTSLRWALLGVTALTIALSWGHNMMWLTDLFIDYFPLYNKFRTVSSILVVAEFTIPTMAVLALIAFVRDPERLLRERLALGISLALTLGVALLLALFPSTLLGLLSASEREMLEPYMHDPNAQLLLEGLRAVRADIVSADAWRSVWVLVLSIGLCTLYAYRRIRAELLLGGLIVITLVDLWMVDKRYLNDEHFVPQARIQAQANPVTPIDREIAEDRGLHYRVMNCSVSTFNDATTSYLHRSIGGYHAAKLGRYQDVIDRYLSRGDTTVMNMLDTKYVIGLDKAQGLYKETRPEAYGAAWLVDAEDVRWVDTATEELDALGELPSLRASAVLNRHEVSWSTPAKPQSSSSPDYTPTAQVELMHYTPNRVAYKVDTDRERLLVMSEIYYPHGWHMTVDGKPTDILRANYLLRAVILPEGEHTVELTFAPQSLKTTERIAWISQLLLLLLALGAVWQAWRSNSKSNS